MPKVKPLAQHLKTLSNGQIAKIMALSPKMADKTHTLIASWTDESVAQRPAIDSFLGDIYSGLQVGGWSEADRAYADELLRILSGLYGILRPLDGIHPYRLEMGYKWDDPVFGNLYKYWGDSVAATLPVSGPIINLAAVEYSKVITPYIDDARLITPSFLTVSPKTGEPTFVTVHAKIARGAFASWLLRNRIGSVDKLADFNELNYRFSKELSELTKPVFICKEFGGLGLSVRLK